MNPRLRSAAALLLLSLAPSVSHAWLAEYYERTVEIPGGELGVISWNTDSFIVAGPHYLPVPLGFEETQLLFLALVFTGTGIFLFGFRLLTRFSGRFALRVKPEDGQLNP